MKNMKRLKGCLLIIVSAILYIYTLNIDNVPSKIVLFQNEEYQITHLNGIDIEGEKLFQKSHFLNQYTALDSQKSGKQNLVLSTFGGLFKKDIEVSVLPVTKVKIGGDCVGIRVYSKGVLVIGTAPVQGMDGKWYEPYQNTKIQKGDKILSLNKIPTETILDLMKILQEVSGDVSITYERNGTIQEETITPITCLEDGTCKLGLWVRDGAMGVGTLTFYEPVSGKVCALGHGISDYDLKQLIDVDEGTINSSIVVSVTKGIKGTPGEIRALLVDEQLIGNIEANNEFGIYGEYKQENNLLTDREEYIVASKNEIEIGPAKIYCTIDEGGVPQSYDINIVRMMTKNNDGSKGMVIEVTDEALLTKTGGIIQGMSGSPIVQNGKFVGAVTHVYVNDPTRGYAILAETLIHEISQDNPEMT